MVRKNKSTSKNKIVEPEFEESADFVSDSFCEFCDMMEAETSEKTRQLLIDASNFESVLSFAMTKLIVENILSENKTEENILNAYAHAAKVVRESSALNSMWGRLVV